MKKASLYLIPTPIGNLDDITVRSLKTLEFVDIILCEDTRETSKLLNKYKINKKKLVSCHEYNEDKVKEQVLSFLKQGLNVGLVTDQGTPLISDPGYKLVSFLADNKYDVISLPGPTAFVPALTISALSPQPFLFYGFLNSKNEKQKKELKALESLPYTIIFYEAPHRLLDTLNNIKEIFGNRNIAIVREISKKYEEVVRGTLESVIDSNLTIKGEFVLVVEGNKLDFDFTNMNIIEHVDFYINDGLKKNEAIKLVANERKIPRSLVYNEYLMKDVK